MMSRFLRLMLRNLRSDAKMLFVGLLLLPFIVQADITQEKATGFHWYTKVKEEKQLPLIKPVPPLVEKAPYDQLMAIRRETLNKLANALLRPSFDATHDYMKAQMAYAQKNQQFVRFWQQVLLLHPELDHTLRFPTDNNAIAIRNDTNHAFMERVIHDGSKQYGLILFYRGESALSQRFLTALLPFVTEHGFSMISVATDGKSISGLPNPKTIPLNVVQKNIPIESHYLPALFLVHLKTQEMSPLSYGFVSSMELKERFLDVATHFKRFSYEGLDE